MNKKIFLIAGEKSGDDIGHRLMINLQKLDPSLQFHGIGGPLMTEAGLSSLFPYESLAVMGFVEVLPKIFELNNKINQTVSTIIKLKPDLIITIDLPGFNCRVTSKLRKLGYKGEIFQYVAPTVWAYKESRAKKFAKIFDRMICILPFEEKYFQAHGMKTHYIGNPVIEQAVDLKKTFKHQTLKILVCPGSRKAELNKLLPIFANSLNILAQSHKFEAEILIQPIHKDLAQQLLAKCNFKFNLITPANSDKIKEMSKCDLALTKSGTVTTEIALSGVPMIVAHKINFLSYIIIKNLIKIPSICLINIISKKRIVPELIQNDCNPDKISALLKAFIDDPDLRKEQIKQSAKIFKILGLEEKIAPSEKLAQIIVKHLA